MVPGRGSGAGLRRLQDSNRVASRALAGTRRPAQLHALYYAALQPPRLARRHMNTAALITFVVIAGLVWGGFLLIVSVAVRKERRKQVDRG
jgi:hypothetical protein